MALRQDFTIDASRDYALSVILTEEDGTTPLDLSDGSLRWAVSRAPGQTPIIAKSSSNSAEIHITSPTSGEATIFVVEDDTVDFGGMTCEHELVFTDGALAEATLFRGLVTIAKSLIA